MATSGVILFGIALVFTFNALVSMLQFIANEDTLQGLVFWTMGSIDRASWSKVAILLVALALVMPLSLRSAWALTALRLGEDRAISFGINVRRCGSAFCRRFRWPLSGQSALSAWWRRILRGCSSAKIIAFTCPPAR